MEIFRGFYNWIVKDKQVERIAKARKSICLQCNDLKNGLHQVFKKDFNIKVEHGYYCNLCKCSIELKTRSESKCPKDKWKNIK